MWGERVCEGRLNRRRLKGDALRQPWEKFFPSSSWWDRTSLLDSWSDRKQVLQVYRKTRDGVNRQRVIFAIVLQWSVRIDHFHQPLLQVEPDLDHFTLLVVEALPLNLAGAVTWGKNLECHVGREIGSDRNLLFREPRSPNQRRIGHTPVTGSHREDAVRRKGHPLGVGAAELGETRDQKHQKVLVPEIYGRHEFDLAIDPFPPLPLLAGGKKIFPSYGGASTH